MRAAMLCVCWASPELGFWPIRVRVRLCALALYAVNRGVGMRIVADKSTSAPGLSTAALVVRKELATSGRYRGPRDLRGLKVAGPAPGTGASTSLYWGLVLASGAFAKAVNPLVWAGRVGGARQRHGFRM